LDVKAAVNEAIEKLVNVKNFDELKVFGETQPDFVRQNVKFTDACREHLKTFK
jgi:hypothetical protein